MNESEISALPAATPVSRLLRLALGLAMVAMVASPLLGASWSGRLRVAAVVAGLILMYTALHLLVSRYLGWLNPWLGAVIAVVPTFLVFLGGGVFSAGAILFIGLSLLLIAALGHPGCEVLAFPALFLRRRTHLACMLFTPVDWIEGKITSGLRSR